MGLSWSVGAFMKKGGREIQNNTIFYDVNFQDKPLRGRSILPPLTTTTEM